MKTQSQKWPLVFVQVVKDYFQKLKKEVPLTYKIFVYYIIYLLYIHIPFLFIYKHYFSNNIFINYYFIFGFCFIFFIPMCQDHPWGYWFDTFSDSSSYNNKRYSLVSYPILLALFIIFWVDPFFVATFIGITSIYHDLRNRFIPSLKLIFWTIAGIIIHLYVIIVLAIESSSSY
jgi:hypothetical protein